MGWHIIINPPKGTFVVALSPSDTADLVQILSPEERLAEAERILSLKSEELAEAQAKKEAIELELAKIQGPEPLEGV